MEFKQGAGVYTANNHEVGSIDRVVIDPKTSQVTHVIVKKGFLFKEDKVVPVDLLAEASGDRVILREHAGDLQSLPDFKEEHFVQANPNNPSTTQIPEYYAPPLYYYPFYGSMTIGYMSYSDPYEVEVNENIPENTVALKEGAQVVSADDKNVGKVTQIMVDPNQDRATHFLISEGIFKKEKKMIPIRWVDEIDEDKVYLVVGSDILEGLPNYSE